MKSPSHPTATQRTARITTTDKAAQAAKSRSHARSPARPPSGQSLQFFATAAKGIEPIVADELRALGANDVREARGGATFSGPPSIGYRACLWLRSANRVLLPLARFPARDADQIYTGVHRMPWEHDLPPDGTLCVDFNGSNNDITNTQFGAQRVKDAIVDRFRERVGQRPSVDLDQPDVRINVHLHRDLATVSLDLAGASLHQRGYRTRGVAAPLKETLAAALLLKCAWPEIARQGGSFVDPMCGSGTFLIEAAMIAGDVAPGLQRKHWGFSRWLRHDAATWDSAVQEARRRMQAGRQGIPQILGFDHDGGALDAASQNIQNAGLADVIRLRTIALEANHLTAGLAPGLVLTNPPYGERIGNSETLTALYSSLGNWLRNECNGWQAGVITGDPSLAKHVGIRARKLNTFYNGALECKLLRFDVKPEWFMHAVRAAG